MPCYAPLHGWVSRHRPAPGKRRAVVFRFQDGFSDRRMTVPCGVCVGCLLERSREWAVRCVHEASLWRENSFVTLTYRESELPVVNGRPTLRPRDFVLFMKRMRKVRAGARFVQAGEYGKLGRPHHHAVLFNCGFPDRVLLKRAPSGSFIFRSALLESLWPHGFSSVGEVTFESAAYVARYTLKKLAPGCPELHDVASGEGVVPPYLTMSRRPGIGAGWYEKFSADVFPRDVLVTRGGVLSKPPRFYDERFRREDPEGFAALKARRISAADPAEQDGVRLYAKAENRRRRVKDYLKRGL